MLRQFQLLLAMTMVSFAAINLFNGDYVTAAFEYALAAINIIARSQLK